MLLVEYLLGLLVLLKEMELVELRELLSKLVLPVRVLGELGPHLAQLLLLVLLLLHSHLLLAHL